MKAKKLSKPKKPSINPFSCKNRITRSPILKGTVSPVIPVPPHILKPPYISDPAWQPFEENPDVLIDQDKIVIHTRQQQDKMRAAGALAKKALEFAGSLVQPGVTCDFIDTEVHKMIIENGAYPSPLGYHKFPRSTCISVNEVIAHGIPDSTVLQEGDMVKIDITVFLDGFHGDNCNTFIAGSSHADYAPQQRMINANVEAVEAAIALCGPGQHFHKIGSTIERIARSYGYLSCPYFTGHGIGENFHAPPIVLHIANHEAGIMKPGMCFTIEPVLKEGTSSKFITWDDQWTLYATDLGWSSQREHTILITETGAEVLTM